MLKKHTHTHTHNNQIISPSATEYTPPHSPPREFSTSAAAWNEIYTNCKLERLSKKFCKLLNNNKPGVREQNVGRGGTAAWEGCQGSPYITAAGWVYWKPLCLCGLSRETLTGCYRELKDGVFTFLYRKIRNIACFIQSFRYSISPGFHPCSYFLLPQCKSERPADDVDRPLFFY